MHTWARDKGGSEYPPQNGCAAVTQDTTYQLLIHLALLPCFWHPPFLTVMSGKVGDSQTVWNEAGKGTTTSTLKCAWWMGSKLVPLSFSYLRSISSLLAGSYIQQSSLLLIFRIHSIGAIASVLLKWYLGDRGDDQGELLLYSWVVRIQQEKKPFVRVKNFHNANIVAAVDSALTRHLGKLSTAMWIIISCGWPNRWITGLAWSVIYSIKS